MRINSYTRFGILSVVTVALSFCIYLTSCDDDKNGQSSSEFVLTLLHNNDGESDLLEEEIEGRTFGGVDRFATLVNNLRDEALKGSGKPGAILASSGDNFLAGPVLTASLEKGVPFFDTIAMDLIGYDSITIGNHEFDLGPDVLADFIEGFSSTAFLTANLDFSLEPRLQSFVDSETILKSTIVNVGGEAIGIIGATTPEVRSISSPRNVIIDQDVVGAVREQVAVLEASGVNKIVLASHLQSISDEIELVSSLSGVDIVIAGDRGDELLANEDSILIPGDEETVFGPYPLIEIDADGKEVPVVSTNGGYKYVGRLVARFDSEGNIVEILDESGPVRVAGEGNPDEVAPDPEVKTQVVDPLNETIAEFDLIVLANTEVPLNGIREEVRTRETNEGNLLADAHFAKATQLAAQFGVAPPDVAIQNGGSIRNDSIIPTGPVTLRNAIDIVPFGNIIAIVPDIPAMQLKEILENAVSQVEDPTGRFAQISGFRFTWNPNGTPQEVDDDGNVITAGTRIVDVILDDGTPVVEDGVVVSGDSFNIAISDFLARGGDQYPFRGAPFTRIGVTDLESLRDFITDTLNGVIPESEYPVGGEGRITQVPQ